MPDTTEKKTYLVNVESNLNKYAKEADDAAKKVAQLTVENNGLKASGKASGEEIEKSNAALRTAKKEYNESKKLVDLQTIANKSNTESRKQLNAIVTLEQRRLGSLANQYVINSKGQRELSKEYIEGVKRLKEAKDAVIAYDKAQADGRSSVGLYSEAIQSSLGSLQAMPGAAGAAAGGLARMTTAAKAFIATPIGPIVAALSLAVGALTSYFKRSEEGQNALTKVTKVLGSILDNILDVVDKLGKALFTAFTKPKEAIKALGDFIQTQISNRIEALKDIGAAVVKIFSKDWKQGFKELGESTVQLVTGVDDLIGKVGAAAKNFFQEVSQDVRDAKALADELAQIAKDEREYLVRNARLAKESAELRADAEQVKFQNAEKALELTRKSFDLDEKVLLQELNIAKRKAANARESARLANSTIETLNEVAQLEADIENKQQQYEQKRRERVRTENKIKKEAFNQEKERLDAILEIEKSQTDAIIAENQLIADNILSSYEDRNKALEDNLVLRTDILKKQSELELKELDKDLELLTISQENYELKKAGIIQKYASEQLKVASDVADDQKKIVDELLKYENDQRAINAKNQLAIDELNNVYEFDLQREKLKNEYDNEIFAAQKTGADVLLINEKYAAAQRQLDEAEMTAKLGLYAGFAGNLAQIFGENTAIGKAAAIAQTTIATYAAAMQAYKSLAGIPIVGPGLGAVAAAAAVATGIANIKKIVSVKSGLPGEGSVAAPTTISSTVARAFPAAQANIFTQPQLTQPQLNALPNQNALTAEDISAAIAKLPPPIVTVEDINARTAEGNKIEVRATI